MSLLSIVQSITLRVLSAKPAVAVASADPKILQAVEFVNEAGQELAARAAWQVLTNETLFNTVNAESQGTLASITAPGFAYIVNNTFWNRTTRRPVFGPRSASEWEQLKAQFMQGPWTQYMIRQNQMLFLPIPPAGQQCAFEWMSNLWASDPVGVVTKNAMNQDTDVSFLDERLITLDALWRFKRANKLSYDEDYDKAQLAINDAISRDGSKVTLNLAGAQVDILPGIVVPAGNWGL